VAQWMEGKRSDARKRCRVGAVYGRRERLRRSRSWKVVVDALRADASMPYAWALANVNTLCQKQGGRYRADSGRLAAGTADGAGRPGRIVLQTTTRI